MADPRLAGLGASPVYAPALVVAGGALLAAWLLSRNAKRR
jgi:Flp pilus assembly protein TadB